MCFWQSGRKAEKTLKLDKKYRILLQGALIFVWLTDLSPLTQTDTYYSLYLLC